MTHEQKNNQDAFMASMAMAAYSIQQISDGGMLEFSLEALRLHDGKTNVDHAALKKACRLWNLCHVYAILAKEAINYESLVEAAGEFLLRCLDIKAGVGTLYKYANSIWRAENLLKIPGGELEYSLIISDMLFDIYDGFVDYKHKSSVAFDERLCGHLGLAYGLHVAIYPDVISGLTQGCLDAKNIASVLLVSFNDVCADEKNLGVIEDKLKSYSE